jgi:CIC family chloride channel protein
MGVITVDDVRQMMFDQRLYDQVTINTLMVPPPETVHFRERVDQVMSKFDQTGAWYLPVLDNTRFLGFVSKSRLLAAYRKKLMEHSGEEV